MFTILEMTDFSEDAYTGTVTILFYFRLADYSDGQEFYITNHVTIVNPCDTPSSLVLSASLVDQWTYVNVPDQLTYQIPSYTPSPSQCEPIVSIETTGVSFDPLTNMVTFPIFDSLD